MNFQCRSGLHPTLQEVHSADDLDSGVLAQAKKVHVVGHNAVRASRDSTLKDAVVVRIVGDLDRLRGTTTQANLRSSNLAKCSR